MGRRGRVAAAGAVMVVSVLAMQARSAEVLANRRVINFNEGWRFAKGSQAGAEQPAFDDSAWQAVDLPHDWAICGPFNPRDDGYAGKLPWKGQGWYRKVFTLDKAPAGRRVYLDFDGVMAFPKVYVNR
jgi:beta-galactosidase